MAFWGILKSLVRKWPAFAFTMQLTGCFGEARDIQLCGSGPATAVSKLEAGQNLYSCAEVAELADAYGSGPFG